MYRCVAVFQMSPSLGEAGAVPEGTLREAAAVVEAAKYVSPAVSVVPILFLTTAGLPVVRTIGAVENVPAGGPVIPEAENVLPSYLGAVPLFTPVS
jgi:hypothetical protein